MSDDYMPLSAMVKELDRSYYVLRGCARANNLKYKMRSRAYLYSLAEVAKIIPPKRTTKHSVRKAKSGYRYVVIEGRKYAIVRTADSTAFLQPLHHGTVLLNAEGLMLHTSHLIGCYVDED